MDLTTSYQEEDFNSSSGFALQYPNQPNHKGIDMLVLTRKSEEKVTIGKDKKVVITILKIQGDKVSIGIEADKETPIYRNELINEESPEISAVELEAS